MRSKRLHLFCRLIAAPQMLNPVLNGRTFSLSIRTVAGFTYHLEYSDFSTNPFWTTLAFRM
jgi:hypothetical protein